jgi:outer membrane protein
LAVKRIIVSAAAAAVLTGLFGLAWGQTAASKAKTAAPAPAASSSLAHKVGLIDMARVFKEYKKFEILREDLKSEIENSDQQAKAMAQKIQETQTALKDAPFKKDSPEYLALETKLTQQMSEFETFRKVAQRDFLRKEADIYKTIYLEALDVVKQAATAWNYTLVIRFNSEELETEDPAKLIQGLNRQVVFSRSEDDITDPVLKYLNEKYERQAGNAVKPDASRR